MLLAKFLGVGIAAALTVAACSDDEPTTAAGPSETAESANGDRAETVTVDIGDFVFDPTPVEIAVGDSVVWENTHDQAHTSSGTGDQRWDTANIQPGDTSDPVTFDQAGTYTYICGLHPFMEGTVAVS